VCVCVAWASAAGTARADPRPIVPDHELGDRWQYLITSDTHVDFEVNRTTETAGGMTTTISKLAFLVRIAADRVMRPHLTAGVHASYGGEEHDTYTREGFLGGVRVGWLTGVGTSGRVHVWARAGLSYGSFTYSFDGGGEPTVVSIRAEVSCPLLWTFAHRVVLGIGPYFYQDLYVGVARDQPIAKTTTFGVQGLIGGWFHGL
jgi:hypothetical protein